MSTEETKKNTWDYKVQIKEFHLDTFGHVNNAAYLSLCEEARWDLIEAGGYGLKKIMEVQKGPVVLEAHIKFKKELVLREWITIRCESDPYDGRIGRMRQTFLKANGDVAAECDFVFAFFDLKARKIIAPTPEWSKAIGLSNV